jgi:hypothetical protein
VTERVAGGLVSMRLWISVIGVFPRILCWTNTFVAQFQARLWTPTLEPTT